MAAVHRGSDSGHQVLGGLDPGVLSLWVAELSVRRPENLPAQCVRELSPMAPAGEVAVRNGAAAAARAWVVRTSGETGHTTVICGGHREA